MSSRSHTNSTPASPLLQMTIPTARCQASGDYGCRRPGRWVCLNQDPPETPGVRLERATSAPGSSPCFPLHSNGPPAYTSRPRESQSSHWLAPASSDPRCVCSGLSRSARPRGTLLRSCRRRGAGTPVSHCSAWSTCCPRRWSRRSSLAHPPLGCPAGASRRCQRGKNWDSPSGPASSCRHRSWPRSSTPPRSRAARRELSTVSLCAAFG
jgi:hypothetical protein